MAYSKVRYIGYQVPTIGFNDNNDTVYGIPPGSIKTPPKLVDEEGSLSADAKVRVQRLIGAMHRARDRILVGDNSQTLKVFIAPEFYFRPNNTEVSYTMTEFRAIRKVLRDTIAAQEGFKDWLVIPGTIMWRQTSKDKDIGTLTKLTGKAKVYFNTSLFIKRSATSSTVSSGMIEKCLESTIDGLPTGPGKTSAPTKYTDYSLSDLDSTKLRRHILKNSGLTIGIEICVEHHAQLQLLRQLQDKQFQTSNAESIDLHLLTACGMPLNDVSISARKNGYVMRNDGYFDTAPRVEMRKVNQYSYTVFGPSTVTIDDGSMYVYAKANCTDFSTQIIRLPIKNTDELYLQPPPDCKSKWPDMKQIIHIYPSQPLS